MEDIGEKDDRTTSPRWRTQILDFSQYTTMHGVRYMGSRKVPRRLFWTLICLAAITLFAFLIYEKLTYLISMPKAVNVEVTYTDDIEFPAVTICNENVFRLTAMQENGLYDILVNGNFTDVMDDHYEFVENICSLSGEGAWSSRHRVEIVETTRKVCVQLCTTSYDLTCSSVLYDRTNRSCILSAYTGDADRELAVCGDTTKEFYRRQRYLPFSSVQLDFEDENFDMNLFYVADTSMKDRWARVQASGMVDNTLGTLHGHYLYLLETSRRPGYDAAFQIPYMDTTDKCLQMMYRFLGDRPSSSASEEELSTLKVYTLDEEHSQVLLETMLGVKNRYRVHDWSASVLELPAGIHQIRVEARRPTEGEDSAGIALDDITVVDCDEMRARNCKVTRLGKDYLGTLAVTSSGLDCEVWTNDEDLEERYDVYEDVFPRVPSAHYCRTVPGMGWAAPRCSVYDGEKSTFRKCDVPYCACDEYQFQCSDGFCLPLHLVCDGVPDCTDGGDESMPCRELQTLACALDEDYLCGYTDLTVSTNQFSHTQGEGRNQGSPRGDYRDSSLGWYMLLDSRYGSPTTQAVLMSAVQTVRVPSRLTYYYHMDIEKTDRSAKLQLVVTSSLGFPVAVLQTLNNDIGLDWKSVDVCLPAGQYAIGFLGTQGKQYSSDLAIDELRLAEDGDCQGEPLAQDETQLHCSHWADLCGYFQLGSSESFQWQVMRREEVMSALTDTTGIPATSVTPECGMTITDPQGFVWTPGYPDNYETDIECEFTFLAPEGGSVVLEFLDFDIEYEEDCEYDYTTIKAYEQDERMDNNWYCGDTKPPLYRSEYNKVVLALYSDESTTGRGFYVKYKINHPPDTTVNFATIASYQENVTPSPETQTRIFGTKELNFSQIFCLSLDVVVPEYLQISMLYTGARIKTLFVEDVGLGSNSWKSLAFDVKPQAPGPFHMLFHAKSSQNTLASLALDNLRIDPGSCLVNQDNAAQQNANCQMKTFNTDLSGCELLDCPTSGGTMCGFVDRSDGPNRWVPDDESIRLMFSATREVDDVKFLKLATDPLVQEYAYLVSPLVEAPGLCAKFLIEVESAMEVEVLTVEERFSIGYSDNLYGILATYRADSPLPDGTIEVRLPAVRAHVIIRAHQLDPSVNGSVRISQIAVSSVCTNEESDDEPSLECTFEDKCGYVTPNENKIAWGMPNKLTAPNIEGDTSNCKECFLFLDATNAVIGDKAKAFSPVTTVPESRQLLFSYYANKPVYDTMTQLEVLVAPAEDSRETSVFTITERSGPGWSQQTVCLPAGTYHVVFAGTLGLGRNHSLGIDNVQLGGLCQTEVTLENIVEDEIRCSFEDESLCGFTHDTTSAYIEWMRVEDKYFDLESNDELELEHYTYKTVRILPTGYLQSEGFPNPTHCLGYSDYWVVLFNLFRKRVSCTFDLLTFNPWSQYSTSEYLKMELTPHDDVEDESSMVDIVTTLAKLTNGTANVTGEYSNTVNQDIQFPLGPAQFPNTLKLLEFTPDDLCDPPIFRFRCTTEDYNKGGNLVMAYVGEIMNKKNQFHKPQLGSLTSPTIRAGGTKCLSVTWMSTVRVWIEVVFSNSETVTVYDTFGTLGFGKRVNHFQLEESLFSGREDFQVRIKANTKLAGLFYVVSLVVDELSIVPGMCKDQVPMKSVTCDFTEDCGYVDESLGPERWGLIGDGRTVISHVMTAPVPMSSGSDVVLSSPLFSLDDASCLTVEYKLSSNDINFSVTVLDDSTGVDTLLDIEVVHLNKTSMSIDLPVMGLSRLMFRGSYLGNDTDIKRKIELYSIVLDYSSCPVEIIEESTVAPTIEARVESSPYRRLLADVGEMGYTTLSSLLAHKKENLVHECVYEGHPCNTLTDFKPSNTDYGYCYTFNSDNDFALRTRQTGAQNGVRLVLNVEQYEHVAGYSDDAGVKIHLHPVDIEAQIRELGFAVGPGKHSLAGVTYQRTISLPKPWGDCSEDSLDYYPGQNYTQYRCQTQQATNAVNETCGCIDAWMPGADRVCDLAEYIFCLRRFHDGELQLGSEEACADSCDVVTHRIGLSSSKLSNQGVDSLLNTEKDNVIRQYHSSSEMRTRVTTEDMTEIIQLVVDTLASRGDFQSFIQLQLLEKMTSVPNRLVEAVEKFEEKANETINEVLFFDVSEYQRAYLMKRKPFLHAVKQSTETLSSKLSVLVLSVNNVKPDNVEYVQWLLDYGEQVQASLVDSYNIMTVRLSTDVEDYQPSHLVSSSSDRQDCTATRETIAETLQDDIRSTLSEVLQHIKDIKQTMEANTVSNAVTSSQTDALNNSLTSNDGQFNDQLDSLFASASDLGVVTDGFVEAVLNLEECNKEYADFLHKIIEWQKEEDHTNVPSTGIKDFSDIFYSFIDDERTLRELLANFTMGTLSKLDIADRIVNLLGPQFETHSDEALAIAQTLVFGPFQSYLNDKEAVLYRRYWEALEFYETLQSYFENDSFKNTARNLDIWKMPIPNLDSPTIISYTLQESDMWRVWPEANSLPMFMSTIGALQLRESVGGYFSSLTKTLTNLNRDLIAAEKKSSDDFDALKGSLEGYHQRLNAEDVFVMNNFLKLDIFFGELKYENVQQMKAYDVASFFGDVGGYMGLLLGGSCMTLCELFDFLLCFCFMRIARTENKKPTKDEEAANGTNGTNGVQMEDGTNDVKVELDANEDFSKED